MAQSSIMHSDRAPLQCLNLSVNYVSHWTYLQGLRELYQNFMDACVEKYPDYKLLHRKNPDPNTITFTQAKRNGNLLDEKAGNYISYNKITKTLTLENQKSFPIKCLLMGCSQKGPEALGQFGEGMKVAMIVLLKADIDIIIESGQNTYYPTIKSWDHNILFNGKYDKDVLYVKVQGKPYVDKTKVIVSNVDQAKFNQFLYLSLALLDQNSYDMLTFGGSTLIIPKDPKLIGKVYKKGVRLQLHESKNSVKFQHYSYNFQTIQVGRERDCVNNVWDLYRLQSQLHYNVIARSMDKNFLANNPELKPKFRQHLNNVYNYMQSHNYQVHFFHQYSRPNKTVCDIIYDKFLAENNNPIQLYPQHGEVLYQISNALKKYGLNEDFYPAKSVGYFTWLTLPYSSKYISVDNKIKRDVIDKQVRELNQEQSKKMVQIKNKISLLFPQINEYKFKVKQFKQITCSKDHTPNSKQMFINASFLDQQDKLTRQICKMLLQ